MRQHGACNLRVAATSTLRCQHLQFTSADRKRFSLGSELRRSRSTACTAAVHQVARLQKSALVATIITSLSARRCRHCSPLPLPPRPPPARHKSTLHQGVTGTATYGHMTATPSSHMHDHCSQLTSEALPTPAATIPAAAAAAPSTAIAAHTAPASAAVRRRPLLCATHVGTLVGMCLLQVIGQWGAGTDTR